MNHKRITHYIFWLIMVSLGSPSHAQEANTPNEAWRAARPLDGLYTRIAEDISRGRPLIINAHYGMWHVRAQEPERNLNWGGKYGHSILLKRAKRHPHVKRLYRHYKWDLVYKDSKALDPLRTLVFHQKIKPSARWRKRGVQRPFSVFLVMQAFADQERAAQEMVRALRQSTGRTLKITSEANREINREINLGEAQVTGYFGHNLFYDYEDFDWDGLDLITGTPNRPKGTFVVGCNTARVPGFPRLITENVYALLFSRSLMASEGYSTLALADGLIRHMTSREMVRFADRTYAYFQKLARPDRRVGRPFVSHNFLMYPQAARVE